MDRPDTNPKSVFGMSKPGIHGIPPVALLHCGRGMEDGVVKYGLTNWRENSVSAGVYYNAAFRHMASWWDGEQNAGDSGVHHLGHVMACCAILLDAEAGGNLVDDRPAIPGKFSAMVAAMTRPRAAAIPTRDLPEEPRSARETAREADAVAATMSDAMHNTDDGLPLCEDEGCPHHGTAHVCVNLPEDEDCVEMAAFNAQVARENVDAEDEELRAVTATIVTGKKVPRLLPGTELRRGTPDPEAAKYQEILDYVEAFMALDPTDHQGFAGVVERKAYVTQWLDNRKITRVRHIGSVRDQGALMDHIDKYVKG